MCYSWLTSNDMKPIVGCSTDKVYVLIPKEFDVNQQAFIATSSLGDDSGTGKGDLYEIVALWNKNYLSEELLRPAPKLENFGSYYDFEIEEFRKQGKSEIEIKEMCLAEQTKWFTLAMQRRQRIIDSMNDYQNDVPAEIMEEKYGDDWLREIGIAIACYDEQNATLPYPIKIVSDPCITYEEAMPSMSDPNQGTGERYSKDQKKYINDFAKKLPEYVAIGEARRERKE